MSRLVHVALPVPSLGLLTYRVPDDLPQPVRGARVLVPLGSRLMTGCALGPADWPGADGGRRAVPGENVRDIVDVLDGDPFLPEEIVDLSLWVSEYYICAPGEALAAAMPPKAWIESERHVQITNEGLARARDTSGLRRAVLDALAHGRMVRIEKLAVAIRPPSGERGRRTRRPHGVHAAVTALERLGLLRTERPLRGSAQAFRTVQVAALTAEGHEFARGAQPRRQTDCEAPAIRLGERQQAALDRLRGTPMGLAVSELAADGITAGAIRRLAARGLVRIVRVRVERDPFEAATAVAPDLAPSDNNRTLTSEQEDALRRLDGAVASGKFRTVLLHGVTGSGKTEVYLRLARESRAAGRRALILVPEIALTPAVATAFRRAFGARVAIQHSGLSDGERHDQWHRIRRGDVDIVVGTRSAVFAPLDRVGLIVVDEEHDTSYKQEDPPRYNGRDVAVMRGRQAGALVVLGSATPSMESHQNALDGRYERVALERRVLDRPLAAVRIVDMREEYAAQGPETILSRALVDAVGDRLARREQVLILLNRRGFATAVFCRQCDATLECPNCSVSLTVHRAERRARCHYCNYALPVPKSCVNCAGPYLELAGFGTERVERDLSDKFPGARVARFDRDTVRRRGAVVGVLGRFASREIDVLVGTQMIAKGHDFPQVTLVGVVSADVGLGVADFRAAERTFQLLTQVAGRAGRGDICGEAIIQTLYPRHYGILHACRQDYVAFFEDEIRYRRAMRYPPAVALVNVIVRAPSAGQAMSDAAGLAQRLRRRASSFRVLGPAPAPLARLRGEHRAQMFLKGRNRRTMREALLAALEVQPDLRRRITIDVDPVTVL
jgi:primosomal protein N' (replication factor Y)